LWVRIAFVRNPSRYEAKGFKDLDAPSEARRLERRMAPKMLRATHIAELATITKRARPSPARRQRLAF